MIYNKIKIGSKKRYIIFKDTLFFIMYHFIIFEGVKTCFNHLQK